MGNVHRYLCTFCAVLIWGILASGQANALPQERRALAQVFASCAGRLSATMEFQWMFDGAASERTDQSIGYFDILLDAAMGPEITGREALNWRIEAKMAQIRLLNIATFGRDPRIRQQANRAAALYLSECESLLLQ